MSHSIPVELFINVLCERIPKENCIVQQSSLRINMRHIYILHVKNANLIPTRKACNMQESSYTMLFPIALKS